MLVLLIALFHGIHLAAAQQCRLTLSSSSTSTASGSSGNCLFARDDATYVAATWYAGWDSSKFPLTNVSWSKYTHVTYSFAWVPAFLLTIRN